MNCNKSCCCWINPNWVNDSVYRYSGGIAEQYLELKEKIYSRRADVPNGESFEQLKGRLKDYTFFPYPVSSGIRMQDEDHFSDPDYSYCIIGLLYLTKFEEEENIFPFTAEQERVIQKSSQTDKAACCWLHVGGVASIVTGVVTGVLPQYWGAISACFSQASGCLATGKYPDLSSVADNTRQNIYHDELQSMYQNMGHELMMLKESDPELAKNIALHLKIERIRQSILDKLWISGADSLVLPLAEAKEYVLHGIIPSKVLSLRQAAEILSQKEENRVLREECAAMRKDIFMLKEKIFPSLRKDQGDMEEVNM